MLDKIKKIISGSVTKELTAIILVSIFISILINVFSSEIAVVFDGDEADKHQSIQRIYFYLILIVLILRYIQVGSARFLNNKDETLINSVWFRRSFDIPFLAFFGSIGLITVSEHPVNLPDLCFSSDCIKETYELYKISFLIMAAGLALSGIAAAIHRSEEVNKQIKISEIKNNFDIFVKHQDIFVSGVCKLLDKYNNFNDKSDNKIAVDIQYLYSKFFENTPYRFKSYYSKSNFDLPEEYQEELFQLYFEAVSGSPQAYTAEKFETEYKISRENLFEAHSYVDDSAAEKSKFVIKYCDFSIELFDFLKSHFANGDVSNSSALEANK